MITARTIIETERGRLAVSHHEIGSLECLSISTGRLDKPGVLVRIHSSCLFGEALGAFDCDCGPQLRSALGAITQAGAGVVVYMFQEGRGAGIEAKIRAMELQRSRRLSSYEAYDRLGLKHDAREYKAALVALSDLKVNRHICLISNNPLKRISLEDEGYVIDNAISLSYRVDVRARQYLEMKRDVGRHTLDLEKLVFTDGISLGEPNGGE